MKVVFSLSLILLFLCTSVAFSSPNGLFRPRLTVDVYGGDENFAECRTLLSIRRGSQRFKDVLNQVKKQGYLRSPIRLKTDAAIQGLFYTSIDEGVLKVEVGAGERPICPDCVFVDTDLDSLHLTKKRLQLSEAAAKMRLVHADIRDLPFKTNSVDVFISRGFPWVRPDPETLNLVDQAFKEINRVLKDDGIFAIISEHGHTYHGPHQGFVVGDQSADGSGFYFSEIKTFEKDIEGIMVSPISYKDAFLINQGHLAEAAHRYNLHPVWFQTPHYDGLLMSRQARSLSRASLR